ncbi:recombinase family protein [Macrococcus capreoli]|uniref:recombinase family protein n=1 Tax=Macrococcus capreoli TaxID=2982690 RepID=UPI0021D5EB68|nr:recombinase family protein [Macrococcus sp. TMW 2.2395]MCU7557961.1 recombinase family protein [Macrococcus sp. TMW 2.2395]
MTKKRAAIYTRVSSALQRDNFSISGQRKLLEDVCKRNDWEVYQVYTDNGLTGKNMNRPALLQMNEDAKNGKFDVILIYRLNRLARNTKHMIDMVDFYNKYNVEVYSDTERFDTSTASGRLMLQILASMAEYDRNQILENMLTGLISRANSGYYNGGQVLGYSQVPGNKRALLIAEDEAIIVKRIFKEYASGRGYRAIANALNKDGYRTKKDNPFDISAIKYILSNVLYIGKVRYLQYTGWNEKRRRGYNPKPIIVEGKHTPIVDKDLWDKVQARRKKASKHPMINGKGENLLTGLVRCPACGSAHAASNTTNTLKSGEKKRIRYYSCSQFRNKGASVCSANSIRADIAEAYVFKRIQEVIFNDKVLQQVLDNVNKNLETKPTEMNQQITHKKQQLEEIQVKLNNLNIALSTSPDLIHTLKATIEEYMSTIEALKTTIAEMELHKDDEVKQLTIEEIKPLLHVLFKDMNRLDKKQLKSLYLSVIDSIHFKKCNESGKKHDFFITLKINEDVLKEVYNGIQPEEALLSASSLFTDNETYYLYI